MTNNMRILVVDDDRRMASTLADILNLEGYQVVQAHSPGQALELARKTPFFCAISDIVMPGMNGADLCDALRQIQPGLMVVLMTAYASEEMTRRGLDQGALAVLEKPLDLTQVLQFLGLLRKQKTATIVDDDPTFCRTLGDILEHRGFLIKCITDPHSVMDELAGDEQVILLDMKLNSINGYDILREIRTRHPNLPVLLVTGFRAEMAPAIEKALAIHAHTCLYKPLVIPELLRTLDEIRAGQLKQALKPL